MKQLLFIFFLSATSLCSYAQDIDVVDDTVFVDGTVYCVMEKEGCGTFSKECIYYIKSSQGKKLVAVKKREIIDPNAASNGSGDNNAKIRYLEYIFLKSGMRAETPFPSTFNLRRQDIAKKMVKAELIKDGELNEEAVNDFCAAKGTPYSDQMRSNGGTTIIINR